MERLVIYGRVVLPSVQEILQRNRDGRLPRPDEDSIGCKRTLCSVEGDPHILGCHTLLPRTVEHGLVFLSGQDGHDYTASRSGELVHREGTVGGTAQHERVRDGNVVGLVYTVGTARPVGTASHRIQERLHMSTEMTVLALDEGIIPARLD